MDYESFIDEIWIKVVFWKKKKQWKQKKEEIMAGRLGLWSRRKEGGSKKERRVMSRVVREVVKEEAVVRRTRRRRGVGCGGVGVAERDGRLLWLAGRRSEQSREKSLAHGVRPA